jgi:hypothetical protein
MKERTSVKNCNAHYGEGLLGVSIAVKHVKVIVVKENC